MAQRLRKTVFPFQRSKIYNGGASSLVFIVTTHMMKSSLGKKVFIPAYTSRSQSIIKGIQRKNSRQESKCRK